MKSPKSIWRIHRKGGKAHLFKAINMSVYGAVLESRCGILAPVWMLEKPPPFWWQCKHCMKKFRC